MYASPMPVLPLSGRLVNNQDIKKHKRVFKAEISVYSSLTRLFSLQQFRQYDLNGNQCDTSRLEECFGCPISDSDYNDLVRIMKNINVSQHLLPNIFDNTVLGKFIDTARFGDRTVAAIANGTKPTKYTYRANFKQPRLSRDFSIFEVGLNLGTKRNHRTTVDDKKINFCIKVCRNGGPLINSMERCVKRFQLESYEFNVHLTKRRRCFKSNIPPTHNNVTSIEQVLYAVRRRNFYVQLASIRKPGNIENYYFPNAQHTNCIKNPTPWRASYGGRSYSYKCKF